MFLGLAFGCFFFFVCLGWLGLDETTATIGLKGTVHSGHVPKTTKKHPNKENTKKRAPAISRPIH